MTAGQWNQQHRKVINGSCVLNAQKDLGKKSQTAPGPPSFASSSTNDNADINNCIEFE